MNVEQDVERDVQGWRLLLPASRTSERVLDEPTQPTAEVLTFKVANRHLPAVANAQAELSLAEDVRYLDFDAKCLDLDEPASLNWSEGERALIFEVDVPRNQVRTLRVSGPTSLAWALFEPGVDGGWRSLANASAAGSPVGQAR